MSMVAIVLLECCNREMSYGRFIPPEHAMKRPETLCPLCFKKVILHYEHSRYTDEHLENIPYVHKYVLPEKPKEPELLF